LYELPLVKYAIFVVLIAFVCNLDSFELVHDP